MQRGLEVGLLLRAQGVLIGRWQARMQALLLSGVSQVYGNGAVVLVEEPLVAAVATC